MNEIIGLMFGKTTVPRAMHSQRIYRCNPCSTQMFIHIIIMPVHAGEWNVMMILFNANQNNFARDTHLLSPPFCVVWHCQGVGSICGLPRVSRKTSARRLLFSCALINYIDNMFKLVAGWLEQWGWSFLLKVLMSYFKNYLQSYRHTHMWPGLTEPVLSPILKHREMTV